jgi:hypothetical protein
VNPKSISSSLEQCVFLTIPSDCQYSLGGESQILKDLTHQVLCNDEYCYYITDTISPFMYVTAVDDEGNEQETAGEPLSVSFEDRLAPVLSSFSVDESRHVSYTISTNIDGSPADDAILYYFIQSHGCIGKLLTPNGEGYLAESRTNEEGITLLDPAQEYCLIAIASDSSGNPLERIEEEGVTKLRVKPEYLGVFDELYRSATIPKTI